MGIHGALSKGADVLKPPFMEGDTSPQKETLRDYTQRERNSDDLSTHKLLKPPYLPCNHMRHGEAGPLS